MLPAALRALTDVLQEWRLRVRLDAARPFGDLWPTVLEGHHVTVSALAAAVKGAADTRRLAIEGLGQRERVVKDHHLVRKS